MAKNTVDDYKSIDARWLVREGYISKDKKAGILHWMRNNESIGSMSIEITMEYIRLTYTVNNTEQCDYRVNLDKTPCYYGGVRYWFICPKCTRRIAKLYVGKYLACRHCHNLTYRSCQEHDKRFAFFKKDFDDYSEYDIMRFSQYTGMVEKILSE